MCKSADAQNAAVQSKATVKSDFKVTIITLFYYWKDIKLTVDSIVTTYNYEKALTET